MYELYKKPNDEWEIHTTNQGAYQGTFMTVIAYCIKVFGFEADELDFTIQQMFKNDHDAAHFGARMKLIYTFNKDSKNKENKNG